MDSKPKSFSARNWSSRRVFPEWVDLNNTHGDVDDDYDDDDDNNNSCEKKTFCNETFPAKFCALKQLKQCSGHSFPMLRCSIARIRITLVSEWQLLWDFIATLMDFYLLTSCKANIQSDNASHTWIEIVYTNDKEKGLFNGDSTAMTPCWRLDSNSELPTHVFNK